MKVANALGRAGHIETVRGRNGGIRLARPAKAILAGAVARDSETGSALVECFHGGGGGCPITPCCKLKGVLAEAQEAFFRVPDRYSLHDLVKRNPALLELPAGEGK